MRIVNLENQKVAKKKLWQFPWDYKESFIIAAGLLITGYLLQITTRTSIKAVSAPVNYIIGALFIAMLLLLHFTSRTHPWVKWLRSVPASVSAIVLVLIQAIIMGTLPQQNFVEGVKPDVFGFSFVLTSWPFIIAQLYFLTTLGLATLNRMTPWQWKNWGFILNHLGLFIAMTAGILGSGDLQRYTMKLYENQLVWGAQNEEGVMVPMPIAFELTSFDMETFTPKLALADITNNSIETKGVNALRMISKGDSYDYKGYKIKIVNYIEDSKFTGNGYFPVNEEGATPAALVEVKSATIDTTAWISCGSFATEYSYLQLNDKEAIVMLQPEAKKYSSHVNVYVKDGKNDKTVIEVNKPYKVGGWKVYQLSYDEKFGKWSKLSVVELVRDPWLPAVYSGIFMMIIGAAYLIFKGRGTVI
ncbi:cytochrome c biogenesis protein ResB [Flavobacterium sp. KBS0721]|uniref:cytochrome c biogenesis protein ResB n=1 Tax=Flavobacterium sp. KBS0721 TaxID=1179672 RepID=UPI0009902BD4|nr:cytochrome c biogenesis protein ResB [Flavobacterium sp. KBS0721]QDW20501.1 cytochrome c biogenesis protein ResB [Flavobacterium sp. KBS0721]